MPSPYDYIAPTALSTEQKRKLDDSRYFFAKLHKFLLESVPPSRYRSLATTALEEASMWANKGITHEGP